MRPNEKTMVGNSKDNGIWGNEERCGGIRYTAGEPFDLNILAEENQFAISVNGQNVCNFKFRQPLNQGEYIDFVVSRYKVYHSQYGTIGRL